MIGYPHDGSQHILTYNEVTAIVYKYKPRPPFALTLNPSWLEGENSRVYYFGDDSTITPGS
jgi:hypothetical protein